MTAGAKNARLPAVHEGVPEAAACPALVLDRQDLEVPTKEAGDFLRRETAPVGAMGDVPRPFRAQEEAELRAEHREDVVAARFQDSKDAFPVSRPVGLCLVMKATIVKDDVEAGRRKRQGENVGSSEFYARYMSGHGKFSRTPQGEGFVIDAGHVEAETARGKAVTPFAAADIQQRAFVNLSADALQERQRIGAGFERVPTVDTRAVGFVEILPVRLG